MRKFAPIVVRIGIALVVLWFGTEQLIHPDMWVFLLPSWTTVFGLTPTTLIYLNGSFEIVFGLALLVGLYTRFVAFVLMFHLFDIAYTVGYGDIMVRDLGLAAAALSVFLHGDDEWSLHSLLERKNSASKDLIT